MALSFAHVDPLLNCIQAGLQFGSQESRDTARFGPLAQDSVRRAKACQPVNCGAASQSPACKDRDAAVCCCEQAALGVETPPTCIFVAIEISFGMSITCFKHYYPVA